MECIGYLILLIAVNIFSTKLGIAHAEENSKVAKSLWVNAVVYIAGCVTGFLFDL